MGSYVSVMNNTDATMYIKYTNACGDKMGAVPQIATLIADEPAIGTSESSHTKASSADFMIDEKLRKGGFYRISPSQSHVSRKTTLSRIQRANIVLVQRQTAGIILRRGAMTVWSGPADNSTMTYNASDCRYELETVVPTW
jgi:hypothetical protein